MLRFAQWNGYAATWQQPITQSNMIAKMDTILWQIEMELGRINWPIDCPAMMYPDGCRLRIPHPEKVLWVKIDPEKFLAFLQRKDISHSIASISLLLCKKLKQDLNPKQQNNG